MIIGIKGNIEKKEPTVLHINAGGLIYEIFVSLNCSSAISSQEVHLHLTQIIREDAHLLYGFVDLNEKQLFDRLLKINGVGPKVALAIISTFTPESFARILTANDVSMLKKVPGIGPKGASRILVELSGFIVGVSPSTGTNASSDAALALESLGFKSDLIAQVLSTCTSLDTSSLVKEALKKLQK